MPPARAAAVLSNGLSPISSSTTSLPAALSVLAMPSTVNAVSTIRERAKSLNCADTRGPSSVWVVNRYGSDSVRQHAVVVVAALLDAERPDRTGRGA